MKTKILLSVLASVALSSCGPASQPDIAATMFPQYDIARAIVGDKLTVGSILPPGIEIHDFEASSRDMITLANAQIVLSTSMTIDAWLDPQLLDDADTALIDLSQHYEVDLPSTDDDLIHYWVDPMAVTDIANAIMTGLADIDPTNMAYYQANALTYIEAVDTAYLSFMNYLVSGGHSAATIYFAGHNALGLFSTRHNLDIVSLFPDFKPDEDLGSAQLIAFVEAIKATGSHYLFIEEMVTPKAATAIQAELARQTYELTLLELHGYHNVSPTDAATGVTYLDLYERNIANIKQALEG